MRCLRPVLVLASFACVTEVPSHVLVRALRAAEAGDPSAWDLCERLEQGQGRGLCKVAAAKTQDDPGKACASITRAYWRGECWFEIAEKRADKGKWAAAVDACGKAEQFDRDCARHLWWIARRDGVADDGLRTRLEDRFQGLEDDLRGTDADFSRLSDALRAAQHRRDPVEEFRARWERALERDPAVRETLCSGREPTALGRRTGGDAALERALDELRAEQCGAG